MASLYRRYLASPTNSDGLATATSTSTKKEEDPEGTDVEEAENHNGACVGGGTSRQDDDSNHHRHPSSDHFQDAQQVEAEDGATTTTAALGSAAATETTSLLVVASTNGQTYDSASDVNGVSNRSDQESSNRCCPVRRGRPGSVCGTDEYPTTAGKAARARILAQSYFFPLDNPGIQRYYRFTVTPYTPIAALYKRPQTDPVETAAHVNGPAGAAARNGGGVTGLLRRSAVVPSHGTDPTGRWVLLSVGGRSGWARRAAPLEAAPVSSSNLHDFANTGFVPAESFRAHEAWMGNHAFLCGGKVMLGSDGPSLLFTSGLLIVGGLTQLLVVIPRLAHLEGEIRAERDPGRPLCTTSARTQVLCTFLYSPWFLYGTTLCLLACAFLTLWIAAVMDPGIIPPRSSPTKPPLPGSSAATGGEPDPSIIMGGPTGYRYCSTCNIYRPPRAKHCNSCNVCVSLFDHHCPWVGNCIGARNRRTFFMFVVSVTLLALWSAACSIRLVVLTVEEAAVVLDGGSGAGPVIPDPRYPDDARQVYDSSFHPLQQVGGHGSVGHVAWSTIERMPTVCFFGLFALGCSWSLASLLGYHALLISVSQTTNERVRQVYRRYSGSPSAMGISPRNRNESDRGCCVNWYRFCCEPIQPSNLPADFSALVQGRSPTVPVESEWRGETQVEMAPDKRSESLASLAV